MVQSGPGGIGPPTQLQRQPLDAISEARLPGQGPSLNPSCQRALSWVKCTASFMSGLTTLHLASVCSHIAMVTASSCIMSFRMTFQGTWRRLERERKKWGLHVSSFSHSFLLPVFHNQIICYRDENHRQMRN